MISNLLRRFADPFLDRQNTKLSSRLNTAWRELAAAKASLALSYQECDRVKGERGGAIIDGDWFRALADERFEQLVRSEQDNGLLTAERDKALTELAKVQTELDGAIVQIGELTLSNGQIALAAQVEFAQIVTDMHAHTDPLPMPQDKPTPGIAVYPKWARP